MGSVNTKVLSFCHTLNIEKKSDDLYKKEITTLFENTMLTWEVRIVGPNVDEYSSWCVELQLSSNRKLNPPVKQIQFQIEEMDNNGSVIESYKYSLDGTSPQNQDLFVGTNRRRMFYITQDNTEFTKGLTALIKKEKAILKLETTIEYNKEDFSDSKNLVKEEASRVDELPEFIIDSLRARHNIKIKTSDGSQFLMANKEMIFAASPFLRGFLTEELTECTVEGANYLETIDIVVTYMISGAYRKPAIMTPEIATECFHLSYDWITTRKHYNLFSCIEKHCYEELQKNYADMFYVSKMLICAKKCYYNGLKLCCIANICHFHYEEFIKTFVDGKEHPLKEEMNKVEGFVRKISIVDMVKKAFDSSKETRVVIKDVSSAGKE